jgi:Fic family protein
VTSYRASIPPAIKDVAVAPRRELAAACRKAELAIRLLDDSAAAQLAVIEPFLARSEAIASSRIEAQITTVDQLARAQAGGKAPESARSVLGALTGLRSLVEGSNTAITLQALLHAHRSLMIAAPSESAYAGKLREVQNWIGGSDYSPSRAAHVPPAPGRVPALMEDLIAFTEREDIDPVLQAALAHAQFESIHPFTDGNGRVGRSLINAVWRRRGLTQRVTVPVAAAIAARREQYFDALAAYRGGEFEEFTLLLAEAASRTCAEARLSAETLASLPARWRERVKARRGSAAARLIATLLDQPVFDADQAQLMSGASSAATYRAIAELEAGAVIRPVTQSKRHMVWAAGEVLDEAEALAARLADDAPAGGATPRRR